MEIDAILAADDPGDLADAICELHDELTRRADAGALPAAAHTLYLVLEADSAMNNEGAQPLIDTGRAAAAVDALRELGAAPMAALLEQAVAEPGDSSSLDAWSLQASDLEAHIVSWVDEHADALRAL